MTIQAPSTDVQREHIGAHEGDPNPSPFVIPPGDDGRALVDFLAKVNLRLGESVDRLTAAMEMAEARLQRFTPVDYAGSASGVWTAPGPLLLNLGSPDRGTYWEVESVCIGGTDVNVVAAGSAGLYVCAVPIVGAIGGLMNLADRASTLPNVGFYGGRELVVTDAEYLVVQIFGGTPGQTYMANVSATCLNNATAGGRAELAI